MANLQHASHPRRPARVASDITIAADGTDVVLWSECGTYYKRLVGRTLTRAAGWRHRGRGREVPISLRHWEVLDAYQVRLHRGRPGAGPSRWATVVIATHEGGALQGAVAFVATHFVAGAWNDKRKPWKKWRQRVWEKSWADCGEIIEGLVDQGFPVVFGGDLNRIGVIRPVPGFKWATHHSIMYLGAVSGDELKVQATRALKPRHGSADHPIIGAEIRLK